MNPNQDTTGQDTLQPVLLPRDAEQLRRAKVLLDHAVQIDNADFQFIFHVAALHLARAIPEYWITTVEQIAQISQIEGKYKNDLIERLREEFESIFRGARRYDLLTDLRRWDFHWEPLINPLTVSPNTTYGRGAPLKLSAGPTAGGVAYLAGNTLIKSGSGRRVGRANYYQIHQQRFVDTSSGEALPLGLAIRQFLEDLPGCIAEILKKPEVIQYIEVTKYVDPTEAT